MKISSKVRFNYAIFIGPAIFIGSGSATSSIKFGSSTIIIGFGSGSHGASFGTEYNFEAFLPLNKKKWFEKQSESFQG